MENLKVSQAIRNLWRLISRTNKYIDETTPWILAKDEDKKDELENVLYHLSDSLRQIGILLKPILLEASDALFKQLGVAEEKRSWDSLVYGAQPTFNVVHKGTPLFPRLEVEEEVDKLKKIVRGDDDTIESDKEDLNLATIDDFAKLDLRIGQIKSCKPHPNADKLLVLKVDAGEGKLRQIVAGIAKYYAPDTLVGKKIVLIRNLEPVTLRGEKSEGMLLAGSGKNRMEILEVSGLRPGDSVS
jgi:methionyl-tRNA synthetase